MSYSTADANTEFLLQIDECLKRRDVASGRHLVNLLAKCGDEEEAERLNKVVDQWDREDNWEAYYD